MARRYWFKAKKYGYGWAPDTWESWVVLLFYVAGLVHSFMQNDNPSLSVRARLINFLPSLFIFSALLISIAYLKGEPPHWQWGEKKKK